MVPGRRERGQADPLTGVSEARVSHHEDTACGSQPACILASSGKLRKKPMPGCPPPQARMSLVWGETRTPGVFQLSQRGRGKAFLGEMTATGRETKGSINQTQKNGKCVAGTNQVLSYRKLLQFLVT